MFFRKYGIALFVSLLVHAGLGWLVMSQWESHAPPKRNIAKPKYIEAKLVELKPKATKPASAKKKPNIVDLTAKKRELEQQKKREAEKKRKQEQAKKAAEQKRRKAEAEKKRKKKEEQERKKAEQAAAEEKRRQQERASLEQALMDEQNALLDEQYANDAQSYAALIQRKIEQNWSRPPSARNGMRCEITIEMLPNGQILNAEITKSSGNIAFDRSALAAVKKIDVFAEVRQIPIEVFDRHFRKFSLGFQPEDLRQ